MTKKRVASHKRRSQFNTVQWSQAKKDHRHFLPVRRPRGEGAHSSSPSSPS